MFFQAQVTRVEQEIQSQFQKGMEIFRSKREWKEASVSELLGPVNMQLDGTERAFIRWKTKNLYLEAKVIREGNATILKLLLDKGHLIPPELLDHRRKEGSHFKY